MSSGNFVLLFKRQYRTSYCLIFVAKPSSQGTDSYQRICKYDVHKPNNVWVAAIQSAPGTRPAVYSLPEVIKRGQGSYCHLSLQR